MQCALGPQGTRLIEESAHLPAHVAKAGRHPKDDAIVIAQFGRAGYVGGLIGLAASGLEGFIWHGFRHSLDGDANAVHLLGTFGYHLRHGFNVAVHGMIKYQQFRHCRDSRS